MFAAMAERGGAPKVTGPEEGLNTDLLELVALREVEARGQPTALETPDGMAPVARLLGLASPSVALLHALTEQGLLEMSGEMPRRYRVTDEGRRDAERLADRHWPRLCGAMIGLGNRLAPAQLRSRLRALGPPGWPIDRSIRAALPIAGRRFSMPYAVPADPPTKVQAWPPPRPTRP